MYVSKLVTLFLRTGKIIRGLADINFNGIGARWVHKRARKSYQVRKMRRGLLFGPMLADSPEGK